MNTATRKQCVIAGKGDRMRKAAYRKTTGFSLGLIIAGIVLSAGTPSLAGDVSLVRDINPVPGLGGYSGVSIVVGGVLYFKGHDQNYGANDELWRSDGTADGTYIVKDIFPGSASSDIRYFTDLNGTLLFTANDGTHGFELWRSNGTEAGTQMVKDIYTSAIPSAVFNPMPLAVYNGNLLFFAYSDDTGMELWKSDGTEAGTMMIKDINPTGSSFYPYNYGDPSPSSCLYKGLLYFSASDGWSQHGYELWRTDGTEAGTVMVKDLYPDFVYDGSGPGNFIEYNDYLYFSANTNPSAGYEFASELWRTDGTDAGTSLIIPHGASGPYSFGQLMILNGSLIFTAVDKTRGRELWKSDGTAGGTMLLKDINPLTDSSCHSFIVSNGLILFIADDGTNGSQIWKTDGTPAGTVMLKQMPIPADQQPFWQDDYKFCNFNGETYFYSYDPDYLAVLWKTDGTEAGTVKVPNSNPGSYPNGYAVYNGNLYFCQSTYELGPELWRYNPAATSTNHSLLGTVTQGGTGIPGVTMSGFPGMTVATNSYGYYSGIIPVGWSGTITPSKTGYSFTPPNRSYTAGTTTSLAQDFTATPSGTEYTISGLVTSGSAGLSNVAMTGLPGSVVTDFNGHYSGTVPAGWSGTVTPTAVGFTFTPPSQSFTNVQSNQMQDFSATQVPVYTISGRVTSGSVGLFNVAMTGFPDTVFSEFDGLYWGIVSSGWSGTITPVLAGCSFDPPSATFTNVTTDCMQNFAVTTHPVSLTPTLLVFDGGALLANNAAEIILPGALVGASPAPTRILTIKNAGAGTLSLGDPAAPSGFTAALSSKAIASGSNATLTLTLSTAKQGVFGGKVILTSNDPAAPRFQFTIIGIVEDNTIIKAYKLQWSKDVEVTITSGSYCIQVKSNSGGASNIIITSLKGAAAEKAADNADKRIKILRWPSVTSITVQGSLGKIQTQAPVGRVDVSVDLGSLIASRTAVGELRVGGVLGRAAMTLVPISTTAQTPQETTIITSGTPQGSKKTVVALSGVGLRRLDAPKAPVLATVSAKKVKGVVFTASAGAVTVGPALTLTVTGGDVSGPVLAQGEIKGLTANALGGKGGRIAMPGAAASDPTTRTLIASGLDKSASKKDIAFIKAATGMQAAVVAGASNVAAAANGLTAITADLSGVLKKMQTSRGKGAEIHGVYWSGTGKSGKMPTLVPKGEITDFKPGGAVTIAVGDYQIIGK